jgi:hypothetical protein
MECKYAWALWQSNWLCCKVDTGLIKVYTKMIKSWHEVDTQLCWYKVDSVLIQSWCKDDTKLIQSWFTTLYQLCIYFCVKVDTKHCCYKVIQSWYKVKTKMIQSWYTTLYQLCINLVSKLKIRSWNITLLIKSWYKVDAELIQSCVSTLYHLYINFVSTLYQQRCCLTTFINSVSTF